MRIAVVSSSSGAGKSRLARQLAALHDVPYVELDGLHHLANWEPAPDFEAKVAAAVAQPGWVVDGNYYGRLQGMATDAADLVVWLDLPLWLCLARLARRSTGRIARREVLWNGNRESIWNALFAHDSLLRFTVRTHRRRKRLMPSRLAGRTVVRLRSPREVATWLATQQPRSRVQEGT